MYRDHGRARWNPRKRTVSYFASPEKYTRKFQNSNYKIFPIFDSIISLFSFPFQVSHYTNQRPPQTHWAELVCFIGLKDSVWVKSQTNMELDMETMAASIGVSVPVLRFLLCFVATVPVSFLWRLVPGRLAKHVYSAFTGALLSYLSFGFSSNLHFLVPMLLGYAAMVLYRPKCGVITFFLGFGYLIGW